MKVIRMETDKNRICIQNLERVGEEKLFHEAKYKLDNAGAMLSPPKELPYATEINGILNGITFDLILDDDYGAELYCESDQGVEALIRILNS